MSLFKCLCYKYLSVLYRVSKSVDMRVWERAEALGVVLIYQNEIKNLKLLSKTLLNKTRVGWLNLIKDGKKS